MRSFHAPGRSPVYATGAMAATSHPLATATALNVLREGGNAVDAALAAVAVLCVVEHPMSGIGGDCFAMISRPDGTMHALNASGRAPAAATPEWFRNQGIAAIERTSPHAVTVPGAVDGWAMLARDHGTRSLGDLLQPAIGYARDGFPVAPRVQLDWETSVPKLELNAGARRHLLFDGRAPSVGQIITLPALAATLQAIAEGGRDAFYTGAVAEDIIAELNALGGLHTLEDFRAQSSTYVDPIAFNYRGLTVHEMPPNNQGVVALMILRVLDRLGRVSDDPASPERYHLMIEAARQAYAVRDRVLADPDRADVDVDAMLSDEVADTIASRIDMSKRSELQGPAPRTGGSDTVYLSVVDEAGTAVSFINSLFADFGSGIVSQKTGVTLQNRGEAFVLDPAHPNCIAPGKRPLHTLVPAIASESGVPVMSFGVMGGAFQPVGHVYVVSNMRDYGMDPQEALDFPRAFFEGDDVMVEETVPEATRAALIDKGHTIALRPKPWGGGQIIAMDRGQGLLIGASDGRKDGCALGY